MDDTTHVMFQNLVESLPRRVEILIQAKGEHLHVNVHGFRMRCSMRSHLTSIFIQSCPTVVIQRHLYHILYVAFNNGVLRDGCRLCFTQPFPCVLVRLDRLIIVCEWKHYADNYILINTSIYLADLLGRRGLRDQAALNIPSYPYS